VERTLLAGKVLGSPLKKLIGLAALFFEHRVLEERRRLSHQKDELVWERQNVK